MENTARHTWVPYVAALAGTAYVLVAWIMGLGEVLEPVVGLVTDREYVREEIPIGVAGLVLLALAWGARARDLQAVPEPVAV